MSAATPIPPRKRFTRDDVRQMTDAGIFVGQRYELVDGDLIDKMRQKPPHACAVHRLLSLLAKLFGPERILVQAPVEVAPPDQPYNEPEPDIAVLIELPSDYPIRHPRGDEVMLIVEVSDTTLRHDLTRKRNLYARAGVPEYWVLDINGRRLMVHRHLAGGRYSQTAILADSESVAAPALDDVSISVSTLLP